MIDNLYKSYIRVYGTVITFIAFILSFGSYYWVGDWTILGKVLLPFSLILFILLVVSFDAFVQARTTVYLPKVVKVMDAYKPYNTHSCILVTKPSTLFGHDSVVTVYRKEDECEILTASGTVLNRQENGYLQIGITFVQGVDKDIMKQIQNNQKQVIEGLLIKPTITKYALEVSE